MAVFSDMTISRLKLRSVTVRVDAVKVEAPMVDPNMVEALKVEALMADPKRVDALKVEALRADVKLVEAERDDAVNVVTKSVEARMVDARSACENVVDPVAVERLRVDTVKVENVARGASIKPAEIREETTEVFVRRSVISAISNVVMPGDCTVRPPVPTWRDLVSTKLAAMVPPMVPVGASNQARVEKISDDTESCAPT